MSIFDHYQIATELPDASQGITKYHYDKIRPDRGTVSLTQLSNSFCNAEIDYTFVIPANRHWVPQRSYFRLRGQITAADYTTQLTRAAGIAPAMNLMGNLFQSGTFKINDVPVSIINKHLTKIDTLEARMSKSKSWFDSVGASINFWDSNFTKRLDSICSDEGLSDPYDYYPSTALVDSADHGFVSGTTTLTITSASGLLTVGGADPPLLTELVKAGDIIEFYKVTAPLGTFRLRINKVIDDTTMTIGDGAALSNAVALALTYGTNTLFSLYRPKARRTQGFELIWTPPFSVFKLNKALPVGKYQISLTPEVEDTIKLKAIQRLFNTADDYKFTIDEMNFYVCTMIGARRDNYNYVLSLDETECHPVNITNTTGDIQFTVSPNTYALTVAFQDGSAGRNRIYSDSIFKIRENQELNLTSLQVNYAGEDKPTPQADMSYSLTFDKTTQMYTNSLLYSGRYFSAGGAETLEEFHDRGMYYYFPFPKDDSDTSTRVAVRYSFSALDDNIANMLVFEHRKNNARVTISNSEVTDVIVERK